MKIIGITTTYNGKDWRWMRGLTVRIIAVAKMLDPADEEYELCTDDRMIQRLGGLRADDLIDVQPWIESEGRFSFVSSDVRAADLACFAKLLG